MKKLFRNIVMTALCFGSLATFAGAHKFQQDGANKAERIQALEIAFITEKLNLSSEEAQKFWPVFNAYKADLKTLRGNFGMGPGKPQPSADQMLDFEQKKLDLKKKYKMQFEGAIGKEKVNTLFHLEEEFRQKLKEMRDQRQQNRGQGPGGARPNGGR
jgi:hypothetical protein